MVERYSILEAAVPNQNGKMTYFVVYRKKRMGRAVMAPAVSWRLWGWDFGTTIPRQKSLRMACLPPKLITISAIELRTLGS